MPIYIAPNAATEKQRLVLAFSPEALFYSIYSVQETVSFTQVPVNPMLTADEEEMVEEMPAASPQTHMVKESKESEEILTAQGTLHLSHLHDGSFWSDMGVFELVPNSMDVPFVVAHDAYTGISKQTAASFGNVMLTGNLQILFANIYDADTLTDMTWVIIASQNCQVQCNKPVIHVDENKNTLMPRLDVVIDGPDTVKAGSYVDLTMSATLNGQALRKPIAFYLTKTNGYIPIEKVDVAGPTRVRAMALGMEAGEVIEIKAGYKFWTNVVSKKLQVI